MKKNILIIFLIIIFNNNYGQPIYYIYFQNQEITNTDTSIIRVWNTLITNKEKVEFLDCIGDNIYKYRPWEQVGKIGLFFADKFLYTQDSVMSSVYYSFLYSHYLINGSDRHSSFTEEFRKYLKIRKNMNRKEPILRLYELSSLLRSCLFMDYYYDYVNLSHNYLQNYCSLEQKFIPIDSVSFSHYTNKYIFQMNEIGIPSLLMEYYKDKQNVSNHIDKWLDSHNINSLSLKEKYQLLRFINLFYNRQSSIIMLKAHDLLKNSLIRHPNNSLYKIY